MEKLRLEIHGMTYTRKELPRLYNSWRGMKARCSNKNQHDYQYYGGKGIKVCEEFLDFKWFAKWSIDNGYKDGYTIDRVNRNMDYTPSNCQWISHIDNVIKANKERYYDRKVDAFKYWFNNQEVTGTELGAIFGVSFSSGCKWIREFKKDI